ncbi:E3 ubiquitin-protein ligase CCNB1IP1 homolog [Selaginella moellendorffii]|uniref:E3 ubiquitin-protein ligase CCNB1IP1 homolog n=1 Tax=Selaginella moellendorffii TaxID=88036 RepID=UPI000D1CD22F|nr:E3 ubiquitin-protein ligase CCNB1IP1 homolog [Selaginella moellendorffii]XP_024542596.1 E3 ubiquitin-protein ligase CCNB1IP1 homolog [Selaginella moellendorffii]|eukprot:XP_024515670.1 E3 ubiquitin-protein ligase CCNB1IP1 homolog [Selaginella moellendorffii]
MRCNACWKELEGRAVATVCGHIFCNEDAAKILTCDSTCPLCEQILSKSNMKSLDLNPNDDWTNMIMAGVPPHCIMKSAFKGVIFWIGQKDVESQLTVNRATQWKQKCKEMEATFMQKMSEFQGAYQKAVKRVQALEAERDSLLKDKSELEEKYSEKSRQKRKLEEMYDSLRTEYEKTKMNASRPPPARMGSPNGIADSDLWQSRPAQKAGAFHHQSLLPPTRRPAPAPAPMLTNRQRQTSPFKSADSDMFAPPPPARNTSNALRNLLLSPLKRPISRLGAPGLSS